MFRPCIDLRHGAVVQMVGATLTDEPGMDTGETFNFVSDRDSTWYATRYRTDHLDGGHVIMLGPGNELAARAALGAWPGGMQVGGGIDAANAAAWIAAGASHVIVTSWLFVDGSLSASRLHELAERVGPDHLVIDLSCRLRDDRYWVVTDRWQRFTTTEVDANLLRDLGGMCAELLVHGVDVEGLAQGIDLDLVRLLADHSPVPSTYAGGASDLADLETVHEISGGRVDLTIGSALDIFGGTGVRYADCVAFNRRHRRP